MNTVPPLIDPGHIGRASGCGALGSGCAAGCGGCVALLALAVGLIFSILAVVFLVLRSLDPCDAALQAAQSSEILRRELGTPMTKGWIVTGSVRTFNGTGTADVTVPVSGPRGDASIRAHATLRQGHWIYSRMTAEIEGSGRHVDLLPLLPAGNRDGG
jgi:hypothetical protein